MYITPLRHGGMHKWLNLDLTRGLVVSKGERKRWLKEFVLVHAKGVAAMERK